MPFDGHRKFVFVYTPAIVGNHNQAFAAVNQRYLNRRCSRVNRVFHQFLYHRRRPFNDLAGGNLINQIIR